MADDTKQDKDREKKDEQTQQDGPSNIVNYGGTNTYSNIAIGDGAVINNG